MKGLASVTLADSIPRQSTRSVATRLPLIAAGSALAGFATLQAIAFVLAGTFEYPLDDVYIHLAMAEGIAHGHYGVNPGEFVAASSSVLYPLLLAPFPGTVLQWLLPLIWNTLAVIACGWLWGRLVATATGQGAFRNLWSGLPVAFAILGPLGLNMGGVAFTAMENSLHAALCLTILLGLWQFQATGRITPWFVAALILSPLLRLEGLALSLGAIAVIALNGQWRSAALLTLATLLPVAAFSALLLSLGLDALPGSVIAKMALAAPGASGVERTLVNLISNLRKAQGVYVAVLSVAVLAVAFSRSGPARITLALAAACGAAQLLAGQIGWMHRYEHYTVLVMVGALILTLGTGSAAKDRFAATLAALAIVIGFPMFQTKNLREYVWNPAAIHLQQAQMARFVHDDLQQPVAVNDLGWMAWDNDAYVLDLWGLGSYEVLHRRMQSPPDGWAGPVLAEHNVHAAIIYAKWFGTALGPGWEPLAELRMDRPVGRLGDWVVTFYADDPAMRQTLIEKLSTFAPTLPKGAALVMLP